MKKIICILASVLCVAACSPIRKYKTQAEMQWRADIDAFNERNVTETHSPNAVLFAGSSSIRLWETIHDDMAPYEVIQRGYGGAKFSDLAVFAEEVFYPHTCQAIVIFVANDISGTPEDISPEEVGRVVRYITRTIRKKKPTTPIFFIEITPTSSRWKVWEQIQQSNAQLKQLCGQHENTYFIATASHFLNEQGVPRDELFVDDLLHLNRQGYQLWTRLIKASLDEVISPKGD